MTCVLHATRIRPMNDRQERRVNEVIDRYHGTYYSVGSLIFGGRPISLDCSQDKDGSHTEIEILVDDKNSNAAQSEFRACVFVVPTEWIDDMGAAS